MPTQKKKKKKTRSPSLVQSLSAEHVGETKTDGASFEKNDISFPRRASKRIPNTIDLTRAKISTESLARLFCSERASAKNEPVVIGEKANVGEDVILSFDFMRENGIARGDFVEVSVVASCDDEDDEDDDECCSVGFSIGRSSFRANDGDFGRAGKATLGTPMSAVGRTTSSTTPNKFDNMRKNNGNSIATSMLLGVSEDDNVSDKVLDLRFAANAMLDLDVLAPSADDVDVEAYVYGRFSIPGRAVAKTTHEKSQVSLSRNFWLSLGCPPADVIVSVRKAIVKVREVKKIVLKLYAMESAFASRPEGAWLRDALKRNESSSLASLEMLASRALRGRGCRVGQLVRLPLLGVSALFEVLEMRAVVDDDNDDDDTFLKQIEIGEICDETVCELLARDATFKSFSKATASNSKSIFQDAFDEERNDVEDDDDHIGSAVRRARVAGATLKAESSSGMEKKVSNVLAGCKSHIEALRDIVTLPLINADLFKKCGVTPPRGALLWGPPGTGKTLLARHAAENSNATLFVVDGPELVGAVVGETEEAIREVFRAAEKSKPAIVLIDELDALCPSRSENADNSGNGGESGEESNLNTRAVVALTEIFDGNVVNLDGIVVLATTNRPDAVDVGLRRPGRFDRELEVSAPDPQQRLEILKAHLGTVRHELTEDIVRETAWTTHGFVGADIAQLVRDAASNAMRRIIENETNMLVLADDHTDDDDISGALSNLHLETSSTKEEEKKKKKNENFITIEDFIIAKNRARPSAMRDINVEIPNVSWDDVGGQDSVKNSLKELVEWAEAHPDALKKIGAKPPNGILLYGPPGCSKTTLARAVASKSKRNFLAVKGPELFSKYVGESEKAVKTLFKRARSVAPSIIFIDEIDGLASSRGGGGTQSDGSSVYDRVVTQLLIEMDGLNSMSDRNEKIAVIAATNRPDLVDMALLRPGRFDRLLFVKAPDSSKERAEILACAFRKTPLHSDVDLIAIGEKTEKFTGADLANLAREAALCAIEEEDESEKNGSSKPIEAVCMRHIEKAIESGSSHASPEPSVKILEMYTSFERRGH
jgi:SpoVK/Ycf46/Vps4 family AAA+-type ATPase